MTRLIYAPRVPVREAMIIYIIHGRKGNVFK